VTNGRSSGKEVAMTFLNSSRATLLNWFVKSKKIAARVGRQFGGCHFSMESCIAFTTKSDPSGMPAA
jgi:hypothetical protein